MKAHAKSWFALIVLAVTVLGVIALWPRSARAAGPWYVAPGGNDSNTCLSVGSPCATINGAIGKTTSGDTIKVAVGTYTATTGSEVVLINKDITLSGGWNSGFTTQSGMSALDAEGIATGIAVSNGVTAIIQNLIIQNSLNSGIYNSGILTLNHSIVRGNTAYSGGGIRNVGTLTINDSAITDNTAIEGGGIDQDSGTLILNNSTVSSNIATVVGPADMGSGGGIQIWGGVLIMNSSTVSGNTAFRGGGGIRNYNSSVTLQNTILADNIASFSPDCSGTINSSGYNLVGDPSGCNYALGTGDVTNVDAKLDPIEGSPGYHPLLPDSPALNAGDPSGCMGSAGLLTTDQRGYPRFGRCDIGAYEAQPIAFAVMTANKALALPGVPVTYTISLNNPGGSNFTNVLVTDTLPISLTYNTNSLTATNGSYAYASGVITWTGSVNAGSSVSITFGATVGQSVPLGTDVANSAVINGAGEIITRTATVKVDFYRTYLPLTLRKYPRRIHGHVTQNGVAVAGVPLDLRFYNGSSWSTFASTTTDADGDYSFLDAPSLGPGQKYYVLYRNYAGTPGRLWVWGTRDLTSYAAGSAVEIGNFDIADIALVSPPAGATVALPYTFQWVRRPAAPSDTYEFDIYDPTDGDPYAYTVPPLGYVGSFTMNSLPPGFGPGAQYAWEIWVYSPDGGYGISLETRLVTFSNAGASATVASQSAQWKPAPVREDIPKR